MIVKLTKMWAGYKPGRIFTLMPDGQANALIRRGFAERVDSVSEQTNEIGRSNVRADHAGRAKKSR